MIGIVFAMVNGTMEEVNAAIFKGASDAVTLCIGLISVLVFWLGMMKIAEHAGLLNKVGTDYFAQWLRKLFPEVPSDHPAMGYIISNMISNLFGLGNAATPIGIKAMEQLQGIERWKNRSKSFDDNLSGR